MECPNCKSKKLIIFSRFTFWEQLEDYWFNVTPFESVNERYKLSLNCKNCKNIYNYNEKNGNVTCNNGELLLTNKITFSKRNIPEKIVLDLDHTIIASFFLDNDELSGDFNFLLDGKRYDIAKRPYLKEFVDFCKENFKIIEVCTASVNDYARNICKEIGLGDVKITSRESLDLDFTIMTRDNEYIKKINNSIVIDDKPQVIYGEGNIILNPKVFWYDSSDKELLKIMNFIKKNLLKIKS